LVFGWIEKPVISGLRKLRLSAGDRILIYWPSASAIAMEEIVIVAGCR
jgi:hypothetical protein